jgi:hypothetical protein
VAWQRASTLVMVAAIASCAPRGESRTDSATASPPTSAAAEAAITPPDSATMRAATDALRQFLEASREGSTTRASLERLTACPWGNDAAPGPMLAAFALLPSTARADTVVGRAVVTTVADQDVDRQHPGYFVARLRVRSDTLEWDLLRSASGDWAVCNGLRFGLTAPDSLTTWRPAGASISRARALVDSVAER